MSFINGLRRVVAMVIVIFLAAFVTPNKAQPHTVLDEENCKMCITVFSDVHIEGNRFSTYKGFGRMLQDARNTTFGNDVGIFLGDSTMNGQEIESLLFYGLVKTNSFADEYINVVGNHDIGNGEGDYDKLAKRFYGFSDEFLGVKTDKPYYYKVINGVYFIALGSEKLCVHEYDASDEQLRFLEDCLKKAEEDNAIAFVCCHHPYFDFSDNTAEYFKNTVSKYKNVFFLSGHTHMPISEWWTFDEDDGIKCINLPKATQNVEDEDYKMCGHGAQIEIYEDEIVVRFRNFYTGEWVEDFSKHYPLVK